MVKRKTDNAAASRLGGGLTWAEAILLRHRFGVNVAVHTVLFALALLLAYLVRFDAGWPGGGGQSWFRDSYLPWLPFFVGLKLIIFGSKKLFRGGWQNASIRDVSNILIASWWFVGIMFGLLFIFY